MKFNFKKKLLALATAVLVGAPITTAFAQPSYEEISKKWETAVAEVKQVALDGNVSVSVTQNGQTAQVGTANVNGAIDVATLDSTGELTILSAFLPEPEKVVFIVKDDKSYVFAQGAWNVSGVTEEKAQFLKTFQEAYQQGMALQANPEMYAKLEKYLDITTEGENVKVALKQGIDGKAFYADFQEVFEASKAMALEELKKQGEVVSDEQLAIFDVVYSEDTMVKVFAQNPKYEATFNAEGHMTHIMFEVEVNVADFIELEGLPQNIHVKGEFNLNYNQPLTIEVPAEAQQAE